jgi:hypothetical protein
MKRDGMTPGEAQALVDEVREEIDDCEGDYDEVESIMYDYLGLEMDYIVDILL